MGGGTARKSRGLEVSDFLRQDTLLNFTCSLVKDLLSTTPESGS